MIGIFDSGTGGLSVLREIVRLLPEEKYVYFSDNAHCPYGEKTPEFIRERCRHIVRTLLDKGAEIIVVACNTATAAAIRALRDEFPVRFIGMEPAVKPAVLGTRTGVIGVLATAGTLKGSKYLNIKGNYEDGCTIEEHVGQGFVELVESGDLTGPAAEAVVERSLRPLLDKGADTIVLGCTHYPFLLETLQKIAGPGIRFIDPAPAVARQLVRVMRDEKLLDDATAARALETGPEETSAMSAENLKKDAGHPSGAPDIELISSGDPLPLLRMSGALWPGARP